MFIHVYMHVHICNKENMPGYYFPVIILKYDVTQEYYEIIRD